MNTSEQQEAARRFLASGTPGKTPEKTLDEDSISEAMSQDVDLDNLFDFEEELSPYAGSGEPVKEATAEARQPTGDEMVSSVADPEGVQPPVAQASELTLLSAATPTQGDPQSEPKLTDPVLSPRQRKKAARAEAKAKKVAEAKAKKYEKIKAAYERKCAALAKKGKPAPKRPSFMVAFEQEQGATPDDVVLSTPHGDVRPKRRPIDPFLSQTAVDRRVQVVSWGMILASIAVVGYGGWTVFAQADATPPEEVERIAARVSGEIGFPLQEGRSYVQQYMTGYLTFGTHEAGLEAYRLLQGLSGLRGSGAKNLSGRAPYGQFYQEIIGVPAIAGRVKTPNVAVYQVSALVRPGRLEGNTPIFDVEAGRQVSYEVSLYYDTKTGFTVANPPAVIANPKVAINDQLPEPAPLGNGERIQSPTPDMVDAVRGFVEGWVRSSDTDSSAIRQYTTDTIDANTLRGLGQGKMLAAGRESINAEFFKTDDPNEIKVRTRFSTKYAVGTQNDGLQETSDYVTTLHLVGDKWLVDKFKPYVYFPKS